MDLDANDLLLKSCPLEDAVLDIDTPKSLSAITSLPSNFQIRTMSDIKTLMEFVAHNYTKGIKLYRGHESQEYKTESTIVRHVKKNKKDCSIHDILDAEKKSFNLFCNEVFKIEWLRNKLEKSNETLFKMSIARHLGLPCRLIDVTASLETAVWFAVMNPKYYNVDGKVELIVLDKVDVAETNLSPFCAPKISYAHEPFVAECLDDLPLGEQRRLVQNGHFIWVDDKSLLDEKQAISDAAFHTECFVIPWQAKLSLAIELFRDVYSGCAYQANIAKIKQRI